MSNWFITENIITTAAIIAAATVVLVAFSKTSKFIKKTVHFFDDYFGEEERPGQDARPGLSQRIGYIEDKLDCVDNKFKIVEEDLTLIKKELYPNSGTSLRDAVDKLVKRQEEWDGSERRRT